MYACIFAVSVILNHDKFYNKRYITTNRKLGLFCVLTVATQHNQQSATRNHNSL